MLDWLADDPFAEIRKSVAHVLRLKVAEAQLIELRVTSAPQWLTGARPTEGDASKVIVVRAGVAFECELTVRSLWETSEMTGVFTWVGVQLDRGGRGRHRVWLDLDGTLATLGTEGELKTRLYFDG